MHYDKVYAPTHVMMTVLALLVAPVEVYFELEKLDVLTEYVNVADRGTAAAHGGKKSCGAAGAAAEGKKIVDSGRPMENIKYCQHAVGSLLHIAERTWPDLFYAVQTLARCMAAPMEG